MRFETVIGIITLLALAGITIGIIGSFYNLLKRRYRQMLVFIAIGFAMMAPLGIFLLPVLLVTKPAERPAERIQAREPSMIPSHCVSNGWNHCKNI